MQNFSVLRRNCLQLSCRLPPAGWGAETWNDFVLSVIASFLHPKFLQRAFVSRIPRLITSKWSYWQRREILIYWDNSERWIANNPSVKVVCKLESIYRRKLSIFRIKLREQKYFVVEKFNLIYFGKVFIGFETSTFVDWRNFEFSSKFYLNKFSIQTSESKIFLTSRWMKPVASYLLVAFRSKF